MAANWSARILYAAAAFFAGSVALNVLAPLLVAPGRPDAGAVTLDVGDLFTGETRSLVFRVPNPHPEPVAVEKVLAECGCTTVGERPERGTRLGVGETLELPVRFDSRGIEGDFSKRLAVVLAGESRPPIHLAVKGRSWRALTLEPGRVAFPALDPASRAEQVVAASTSPGAPPLRVTGVTTNSPFLEAKLLDADGGTEGSAKWLVRVSTSPPLPPGRTETCVFLETTAASLNPITLPVVLVVSPPGGRRPAE